MDEAKIFINEVHLKMAGGNYDFIYDSLSGKQITDYSSKQELSKFFANFLDSADITEVKKGFGYSMKTKNGITNVESKYTWYGKNYNIKETIIVMNEGKGYKLEGINLKKI